MGAIERLITGPTGVGKTSLAQQLASLWTKKLINADAFQFYREIPIISNQETFEGLDYEFLGFRSLDQPWNAGEYSRACLPFFSKEYLWVGTGLYLGSALYGLDEQPIKSTPFQGDPRSDFRMLVLDADREELYEKLNQRVEKMIERGAFDEAESVFQKFCSSHTPDWPSLKAIGLRQLLMYFRGEVDRDECIRLWKQESRRLAKRQWTWLRKFCPPSERVLWVRNPAPTEQVLDFLQIS